MAPRAQRWSIAGAALGALAASSCCLGPLLLAVIGVSGAGAMAALGAYRPYLLTATAALVGAGFYFAYRTPKRAPSGACDCERPRANRAGRIGLWLATVAIVLVAAAPPLLARMPSHASRQPSTASLTKASIRVQGVDCEACALPMRKALGKVGGFHDLELDVPKQSVTVTYEPAPGRLDAYVAALDTLGYEATPSEAPTR